MNYRNRSSHTLFTDIFYHYPLEIRPHGRLHHRIWSDLDEIHKLVKFIRGASLKIDDFRTIYRAVYTSIHKSEKLTKHRFWQRSSLRTDQNLDICVSPHTRFTQNNRFQIHKSVCFIKRSKVCMPLYTVRTVYMYSIVTSVLIPFNTQ